MKLMKQSDNWHAFTVPSIYLIKSVSAEIVMASLQAEGHDICWQCWLPFLHLLFLGVSIYV